MQISDLHFGRDDPDLYAPLTEALRTAKPDLVLMAGDFVQRARGWQFSEARAFMDGLGLPWIGVPGNHDIPLWNLPLRLIAPYRTYRRWIADDREPCVDLPGVRVIGLDTTDPLSHQRGRVRSADIERIGAEIAGAGDRLPVILAHHPFHHAADVEKNLMVGAPRALDAWAAAGPHIILSGHLHTWLVEPFLDRKGGRKTLQVHCGTGLSVRRRGDPNDFAILECAGRDVTVTHMVARDRAFVAETAGCYRAGPDGWHRVEQPEAEAEPRLAARS
ncbi:metallophosphoesterase [Rhodobacterales bacterium HKCCE2091]|nr:metallophosphoesterase [Rhodobacterales bacterium HKCCE2091]